MENKEHTTPIFKPKDTSNDKALDEALYSKINPEVKEKFTTYCLKAKILKIDSVNNQRKLIELALTQYMDANPLKLPT